MENVCPTPLKGVTEITAILAELPVFAAAVHWTKPGPIPVAPDMIVTQASLLVAVHWSEESDVFTLIVPVSPVAAALADDGLMLSTPPS
jgi:hypothetical protein